MIEKSFCWCATKNSISNRNNRSRRGFNWEVLFLMRSSVENYFNWHFLFFYFLFFTWDSYKRTDTIFITFFFLTWDNFCLFYWRGSYFLTNVSSGKFFLRRKVGKIYCTRFFIFLTSLGSFFFFLTTRWEFFMLLNRSRSLLMYYFNLIFKF